MPHHKHHTPPPHKHPPHHPPKPQGPRPEHKSKDCSPDQEGTQVGLSKKVRRALVALLIGTAFAGAVGFLLAYLAIELSVILPVIAPVWVGVSTIAYMVLTGR